MPLNKVPNLPNKTISVSVLVYLSLSLSLHTHTHTQTYTHTHTHTPPHTYIYNNKYIYLRFIYLMPWKFVCDLRFHEVLQKTIVRQITKGNSFMKLNVVKNFQGIKYINLKYTYLLLLLCNSSISDIEHSPNYIALGSPQTH